MFKIIDGITLKQDLHLTVFHGSSNMLIASFVDCHAHSVVHARFFIEIKTKMHENF